MTQTDAISDPADGPICVAALYQFTPFEDREAIRIPLATLCEEQGVRGTILVAHEGLNGTIAGSEEAIGAVLDHIRSIPGCANIEVKFSGAPKMPFLRMKVRIKKEIVTMGQPDLDPVGNVGTYVAPQDWNDLINDPATIVIDTRNDYEVGIGTFRGAIDPETTSFREFPEWFRAKRAEFKAEGKQPKIAMFCTGGIRCEKSTAFLKSEGMADVYHLKGGILKYLETVPEEESLWEGECFVFDERVSVKHGLEVGTHTLCRACRNPMGPDDLKSELFEDGISCPNCYHTKTEEQRARYAERQKQAELAKQRGEAHIGDDAQENASA
ncbi:rhodanese-related sulfurtransferase [Pontixanthobacter aestiaquae]|uniref:tRNA uridine(34) hydroxylase n=2 Tax=Pontixanthobacter aestiaquae TaxID=1509367 RepID=A0A844Z4T3_9SPHN|nr:rhodanese-related sulfurtransferase [Pontixanthobacter aestiaquae]MDN3647241.1 rhodanese-related sulfurtransferase [Pontixanthobacter aestiaquae]MXO81783.1 rhodanese-related sulfurtransferase [Pontixanthobacter aestiaquae]